MKENRQEQWTEKREEKYMNKNFFNKNMTIQNIKQNDTDSKSPRLSMSYQHSF